MSAALSASPKGGRIDRTQADRDPLQRQPHRRLRGRHGRLARCSPTASTSSAARSSITARAASSATASRSRTRCCRSIAAAGASIRTTARPCIEAVDGLSSRSQNHWPSLELRRRRGQRPALAAVRRRLLLQDLHVAARRSGSKLYEPAIRAAAGLGRAPSAPDPDRYQHTPRALRRAGRRRRAGGPRGGAGGVARRQARHPRRRAGRDGRHAAARRDLDHRRHAGAGLARGGARRAGRARQRHRCCRAPPPSATTITTTSAWRSASPTICRSRTPTCRASGCGRCAPREVVLATGAHERPLVFADNDRPGIMLAESLRAYVNRYGVAPGRRVVIATSGASAYTVAPT